MDKASFETVQTGACRVGNKTKILFLKKLPTHSIRIELQQQHKQV